MTSDDSTPPASNQQRPSGLAVSLGSDVSDDENILQFHPDMPPLETSGRKWVYCEKRCQRLVLDEHTRTIKCSDCGKVIDPFDWLYRKACQKENKLGSLKSVTDEIRAKSKELKEIKTNVKNAKAQLRRATAPLFNQNSPS